MEGIATVIEENDVKTHTTIQLCDGIRPKSFVRVLQFLYTGLPNLPEDVTGIEDEIHDLSRLAKMFGLGQLDTICDNCLKEMDFLNPSIGTFLNDETGKRMKDMFLNNPEYADVIFHIEGTKIYANKVVLGARCEVMSAMFGGSFCRESEYCVRGPAKGSDVRVFHGPHGVPLLGPRPPSKTVTRLGSWYWRMNTVKRDW